VIFIHCPPNLLISWLPQLKRFAHIGGGTPSWLPLNLVAKIFKAIKSFTSSDTEWTVEANPESLNKEFLKLCQEFGVNRLSLGVQSFSSRLRRILERDCSEEYLQKACELLSILGQANLNIDLIYAIPSQNINEVQDDLDKALNLRPQHLSYYRLTLSKKTRLGQALKIKTEKDDSSCWEENLSRFIQRSLRLKGYCHYEVSNFCLPGKECRHNLHYWQLDPYLGIGPAATSNLPLTDGQALRLEKPFGLKTYLAQGWSCATKTELVNSKSLLLEHLLMGLRLKKGIDLKRLKSRFPDLGEKLEPLLNKWKSNKLIKKNPHQLSCTSSGLRILNVLLREAAGFLAELKELHTNWP